MIARLDPDLKHWSQQDERKIGLIYAKVNLRDSCSLLLLTCVSIVPGRQFLPDVTAPPLPRPLGNEALHSAVADELQGFEEDYPRDRNGRRP
jgi:hypothetical protein